MIELTINGKKIRFYIEAGWFGGEDFVLIGITLFHKLISANLITILGIKVAKFHIEIGFDW